MRWTTLAIMLGALLTATTAVAHADLLNLQAMVDRADPGSTITIPPGVYASPIRISKTLTLIADGLAIIDGGGAGNLIEITAPHVTVRGFHLRNTGHSLDRENAGITIEAPRATIENNVFTDVLFGVYLRKADHSVLRGNTIGGKNIALPRRGDGIRLWQSPDCLIEDNTIHNSRDVVIWFSDRTRIRHNTITHGRYGLHFMYSDDNVLEDNTLRDNSVGAFLMYSQNLTLRRNRLVNNRGPSGFGVGLKDVDRLLAQDNLFASNRIGVQLDNSPSNVDIRHLFADNVFAYNDIGVALMPSVERNDFTGNTFLDNTENVAILGGGKLTDDRFTVDGKGNYWSDYAGYDADNDGVGDLPYRAQSLFENLMTRHAELRLFLYSPVQQAIESAARIAPIVKPAPVLVDSAPLMTPTKLPNAVLANLDDSNDHASGAVGVWLLALGLFIMALLAPVDNPFLTLRRAVTRTNHAGETPS